MRTTTWVRISIRRHTGIGLDSRELTRIFEPGFSPDSPAERAWVLAVVYQILQGASRTRVRVETEKGKGAEFVV